MKSTILTKNQKVSLKAIPQGEPFELEGFVWIRGPDSGMRIRCMCLASGNIEQLPDYKSVVRLVCVSSDFMVYK